MRGSWWRVVGFILATIYHQLPGKRKGSIKLNLLGIGMEKGTQLYFRDDGKFHFRQLRIEDTVLKEIKDGIVVRAWKHFFQTLFPFEGYKGIKADRVTLGYSRDIILDPLNMIPEDDKPTKHSNLNPRTETRLVKAYITDVAETQLYKVQSKPEKHLLMDIITGVIGVSLVVIVFAILITVAKAQ